jgi:hypothetical protein
MKEALARQPLDGRAASVLACLSRFSVRMREPGKNVAMMRRSSDFGQTAKPMKEVAHVGPIP